MVDIDINTKQTAVTSVRSELYIHERRQGKAPVPPPRRRQKLRRVESRVTEGGATGMMSDTQSFVIAGMWLILWLHLFWRLLNFMALLLQTIS